MEARLIVAEKARKDPSGLRPAAAATTGVLFKKCYVSLTGNA
jgi:hypothetical protein